MPLPDLIFDVGLNNGDDTAYYLALGFRVLAIEAASNLAEAAARRFEKSIAQGKLRILNVGIADREGVLPFWICEGNSEWSSFDRDSASRGGHSCHAVDVPCVPFGNILRDHGVPNYLKIDIELHDRGCLDGLDRNNLPTYVSLELTDASTLTALRDIGYNRFKIIIQNNHQAMRARPYGFLRSLGKRAPLYWRSVRKRLGLSVRTRKLQLPAGSTVTRWRFPYGSSGPFGEQTDGEWLPYEQIAALYADFRNGRTEYGDPGNLIWHDVHATSSLA